jgi:hypothetical protein
VPPCTVRRVSARCPDRRDALAASWSFSSLIILAAALTLGLGGTGHLALLGARAAHRPDRRDVRRRPQLQPSHHFGRCSRLGGTGRLALLGARAARCLTGVGLAAPAASARSSSRPLFPPSAWAAQAASHLSARAAHSPRLGRQGRLTLPGARAARSPDRHDARRRLQVQLSHHLGRCSRPLLGRHRPPRTDQRACSSSPRRA